MRIKALKAALPYTFPILAGYWFLGLSYGIYMCASGFSFWYPMIMAIVIFGGSLEFIAVALLLSPFAPLQTLIMAILVQARHVFYGISMLDKYKGLGALKPYMIFGLTDETFAVNYTAEIPEDVDKRWFMFWVTIMNQIYWVTGATMGGLIGSHMPFEAKGISFVLVSMFVVIFLDQWLKEKIHVSELIGFGASLVCLFVFGPDSFMIPTMIIIVAALAIMRRPIERMEVEK